MSFAVESSERFEKQLKRLLKKYPSLAIEVGNLVERLMVDPRTGTPLGKDLFKIRLAIRSKSGGKSGGARVITCVKVVAKRVILAAIYDKSEVETLTNRELVIVAQEAVRTGRK